MSDPSSASEPGFETPPMAFETSPRQRARSTPKQKGAAKGERSSKHGRRPRPRSAINRSPTRDSSHSSMKDSSSGIGPSRHRTQAGPQHTNRQERDNNPIRHDTSTFVPGQHTSTYSIPYYNSGPQMVLHEGYNPFRLPGYSVPAPMPAHVPMPSYPQQAAAPPHPSTSPEAEELKRLKKVLEEESTKRMLEEEQKRRDALEQKMKKEADEAALKRVEDMKRAEEAATREIQEIKREAYNAALEAVEAEEQRRRRLEKEVEQYRRMAREKVEAEMLLEAEQKRRAEEERLRIATEAEARVAREMEQRRRLRAEEEQRMAQIRQEAEDRVRAQILEEEATHFAPSRKSGSLGSRSSKHGGRSSSSTTSSSRMARLRRLIHDPEGEIPAGLSNDIIPDFARDPFTYFQGQSTAPPSLADERPAMNEPCCRCGRKPRDQSLETLASRIREPGLSYGDLGTVLAQRGRSGSPLPASRLEPGGSEVSDNESSEEEWSSASTISTASDLRDGINLEIVDAKSMASANTDKAVFSKMRSQSNLARYDNTSMSKSRESRVQSDNEVGPEYNLEAPRRLWEDVASRTPTPSSFPVFQYLITDESSEDEDDDLGLLGEDDDSTEGGATLTSQNGQEASNNTNSLTKDEAENRLVATRKHQQTGTTQARGDSSQEKRLLLFLTKHINDSKQASQYNNFVDVGSASQDWRTGQTTGNYATSHPMASGYGLDCFTESMYSFVFPSATIGGQRKRHGDGLQRTQVPDGPAFEPTSSLLASQYRPMVPIALMPCIVVSGSAVQSFLQVPISHGNENSQARAEF